MLRSKLALQLYNPVSGAIFVQIVHNKSVTFIDQQLQRTWGNWKGLNGSTHSVETEYNKNKECGLCMKLQGGQALYRKTLA